MALCNNMDQQRWLDLWKGPFQMFPFPGPFSWEQPTGEVGSYDDRLIAVGQGDDLLHGRS